MEPAISSIPNLRRAWLWWAVYVGATTALYALVTLLPQSLPVIIPPTAWDLFIPVLPWSAWLYATYFLLLPVLICCCRGRSWFIPAFFSGSLATGWCLFSHLFFPTAVERGATPMAQSFLLDWIYWLDAPYAALPSGHVALPVAIAGVSLAARSRWGWLFSAWALVLIFATMATGQHVGWDVLGGLAVGTAAATGAGAAVRAGVDFRSLGSLLLEWAVIVLSVHLALRLNQWWAYAIAGLVIATRQHGLLMLFHDAVHRLLARSRRVNDVLINLFVGIPHLLPIETYRTVHLAHHRFLGTENDPEPRFLYAGQPWHYQPLRTRPLMRQVLSDVLGVSNVKTYAAWRRSGGRINLTRGSVAIALIWSAGLSVAAVTAPGVMVKVVLLWLVPLFTVTNLLQKLRSFAEHSAGPGKNLEWPEWTYSWRVGWIGRLTVWPYQINRHREHHEDPATPWHALPTLGGGPELDSSRLSELVWARGVYGDGLNRDETARRRDHARTSSR